MNKSAVIVLHDKDTDSLVLTKRTLTLSHHPGEICFPGGRWEAHDETMPATALRELYEELGIDSNRIELVKELEPERTLLGTVIYPCLGNISSLHPYKMNETEVAEVLCLPMKAVTNYRNYQPFEVIRYGKKIKSWRFMASSHLVWGATARIMMQLC